MGFLSRINSIKEEKEARREAERQRLMSLNEKELLVEMVLLLEDISMKEDKIQRQQVIFSD